MSIFSIIMYFELNLVYILFLSFIRSSYTRRKSDNFNYISLFSFLRDQKITFKIKSKWIDIESESKWIYGRKWTFWKCENTTNVGWNIFIITIWFLKVNFNYYYLYLYDKEEGSMWLGAFYKTTPFKYHMTQNMVDYYYYYLVSTTTHNYKYERSNFLLLS